jgi:hypothetical protein
LIDFCTAQSSARENLRRRRRSNQHIAAAAAAASEKEDARQQKHQNKTLSSHQLINYTRDEGEKSAGWQQRDKCPIKINYIGYAMTTTSLPHCWDSFAIAAQRALLWNF